MQFPRSSGILLHPTSLCGPYGIGDLGPEARRFADFLHAVGMRLWQVLPLGPTGYGDSPYQLFSAFAGNPLLISPDLLVEQGYLEPSHLDGLRTSDDGDVDFPAVMRMKFALLDRAFEKYVPNAVFEDFCAREQAWLDDYALFAALKQAHGGEAIWSRWGSGYARREPAAIERARHELRREIERHRFRQFLFFEQWQALRIYCHERGIRIFGDMPIYVAHDSADVWSHPELFRLNEAGDPEVVAGVPPDYFTADGQLWGNPIYRWDLIERQGYQWWVGRFQAILKQVDMVRLDHFRGFQAYWEVPGGQPTARHGRWVDGPGGNLFAALEAALGQLPIVAENLGVITPEVESIRERFGFPGMTVLQFAFGSDPQGPSFRPHNYARNSVAYSGTHDNDTTLGWWHGAGASTRTHSDIEREHEFTRRYLRFEGDEVHWIFIQTLLASVAATIVVPMQDVLGLGSAARMNLPGSLGGNWRWRYRSGDLTPLLQERLRDLVMMYDR